MILLPNAALAVVYKALFGYFDIYLKFHDKINAHPLLADVSQLYDLFDNNLNCHRTTVRERVYCTR